MKWNIVLDSSCDLKISENPFKNASLKIAPLKIIVGDKEFKDDDNVDYTEVLKAMEMEKKASSSACPSPDEFMECYKDADCCVCITMTGALSGTNNAARLGADMMKEEYPDKKVFVLDSHSTGGSMVLLARKADELIGKGLSFEQVCSELEEFNKETELVFCLVKYDNLVKSGRMNPLAGIVASHLGIRAVAEKTPKGEIKVVHKTRGEDKTLRTMVEHMLSKKNLEGKPVVINHCNNDTAAEKLISLIKEKCKTSDITVLKCKGLTTFYAMEKGILIGY